MISVTPKIRREPYLIVDKDGEVVAYARDYVNAKFSLTQSGDVIYKKLK